MAIISTLAGAAVDSLQREHVDKPAGTIAGREIPCTGQIGHGDWHAHRLEVEAGRWRETLPNCGPKGGGGKDHSNSMPASSQCIQVHNLYFKVMHYTDWECLWGYHVISIQGDPVLRALDRSIKRSHALYKLGICVGSP